MLNDKDKLFKFDNEKDKPFYLIQSKERFRVLRIKVTIYHFLRSPRVKLIIYYSRDLKLD